MPGWTAVLIHWAVQAIGWRAQVGRTDVRNLLTHLGDARLEYREVRDLERRERSAAALGLDGLAVSSADDPRARRQPRVGAVRLLFVASSPGAGATSIAVALSQMLAQEGDACGAVDLSPIGELARRLGAPPLTACSEGCPGLHVAPEGGGVRCASVCGHQGQGLSALAAAWDRIPEVLDRATVVVDASHDLLAAATQRLDADAVVVVLRPAAGLCDAVARAIASEARAPLHFLLNAFDGRREADRAARAALEARLGPAFMPIVVHEDPALAELQPGASLAERCPESQVLRDLAELSHWLWKRQG